MTKLILRKKEQVKFVVFLKFKPGKKLLSTFSQVRIMSVPKCSFNTASILFLPPSEIKINIGHKRGP